MISFDELVNSSSLSRRSSVLNYTYIKQTGTSQARRQGGARGAIAPPFFADLVDEFSDNE